MTVRSILAQKGTAVATIEPDRSVGDAVKLLADRRIGAVVVAGADRTVRGILSERDVVRVVAAGGPGALDQPVTGAMTARVVTCEADDTVNEIMERMTAGKFRHVPVVEGGKLAGIVSIGDVVKHRLMEMERESRALKEYILTA